MAHGLLLFSVRLLRGLDFREACDLNCQRTACVLQVDNHIIRIFDYVVKLKSIKKRKIVEKFVAGFQEDTYFPFAESEEPESCKSK
jgi:hypothetical protein